MRDYHKDWIAMEEQRKLHKERGDCGIKALALSVGISYAEAKILLERHGKRPRSGIHLEYLEGALTELGIRFYKHKPKATAEGGKFTNKKVGKLLPKGRHIVGNRKHVLAVVDGVAIDWSAERSKRIDYVYTLLNV